MADNRPLWALISKYVNQDLLKAIAAEHEKGRILLVGTTNLDARQPVVWNMGLIAASGSSASLRCLTTPTQLTTTSGRASEMSVTRASASEASLHVCTATPLGCTPPADRSTAVTCSKGDSARTLTIMWPSIPVAPRTITFI